LQVCYLLLGSVIMRPNAAMPRAHWASGQTFAAAIHSHGVGWLLGCRSLITALTAKSFCKRLGLRVVGEFH